METTTADRVQSTQAGIDFQASPVSTRFQSAFLLGNGCQQHSLGRSADRMEHPVAYISRKLSPQEQKFCTREKEALAIFYGERTSFVIFYGERKLQCYQTIVLFNGCSMWTDPEGCNDGL